MRGRHGGHLGWWRVSLGSRHFFSALWAEQGWACEPRGSAGLERRAEGLRLCVACAVSEGPGRPTPHSSS